MHIIIDGRAITDQLDGIGRYSINIIENVTRLSPGNDYAVIVRKNLGPDLKTRLAKAGGLIEHHGHMSLKGMFILGKIINDRCPALYHSLFMFKPPDLACPALITIHDLMWLTRPREQAGSSHLRLAAGYLFHYFFVTQSLASCHRIIAVSHETARETARFAPGSRSKINVIGEGIDPIFHQDRENGWHRSHLRRMGLADHPFFLHISNGKPYKNTGAVIEAFARMAGSGSMQLAIIGRRSAFSGRIETLIENHRLEGRILFLGSVSNLDVAALLKGALALVFPSLYEGFGLPVVEAMASDCPVLTSNRGALKEVAGDSALLVDPKRVASIANGMGRLAAEPRLREALISKGRQRANAFNWEDTAQKIGDLYGEFSP